MKDTKTESAPRLEATEPKVNDLTIQYDPETRLSREKTREEIFGGIIDSYESTSIDLHQKAGHEGPFADCPRLVCRDLARMYGEGRALIQQWAVQP